MPSPLSPAELRKTCPLDAIPSPEELAARVDELPGQARARDALAFGIGMVHPDYNLFVIGPHGFGKHHTAIEMLEERAAQQPAPTDDCYVRCFADERRPKCLRLPAGRGAKLRDAMAALVADLLVALPATLESQEHRNRRLAVLKQMEAKHQQALEELKARANERGVSLMTTPNGFVLAPLRDGKVLEADAFDALPEEQRKPVLAAIEELEHALEAMMRQLPGDLRIARDAARELDREVARHTVAHLVESVVHAWTEVPAVVAWLGELEADVVAHSSDFLPDEGEEDESPLAKLGLGDDVRENITRRYAVNLIVERTAERGAPVVYEDNPTLENLVGRVEYRSELGSLVTDFTMIRGGALHRANGGYLVLDASKVLRNPYSYEALLRALSAREIRIQSLSQALGLHSTVTLEPDPIPLAIKVVLVGDRMLHHLLVTLDPELARFFKVVADFDDDIGRGRDSVADLAALLVRIAHKEQLLPVERSTLARLVEHAGRLAEHSERLSLHVQALHDLLREADQLAKTAGATAITAEHVELALAARRRRSGRIREDTLERLRERTLLVATEGAEIGQLNGLSVVEVAGERWGQPSRITARVRAGKGEVVDIEREVELGGPIHSKGVMILTGFLGGRYLRESPLALAATLVFEQSYGGVEGDSASMAELCALLSAIAEVPLFQHVAVTGSVSQRGEAQPVGGINEKIEAFHDACLAQGRRPGQGVIIPSANRRHLMLRPDVVQSVADGLFAVWAVDDVDQAIALLTGLDAASFNARVDERLQRLAALARADDKHERSPSIRRSHSHPVARSS